MSARGFVNLHTHSHYSLLEALPKIPELVAAAKTDGQESLALTDNGNMYGSIEFYKECVAQGVKPIIGVDFFVAARTRHDKEHRTDDHTSRLVLLAQNKTGYHNLIQLVTKAHLEGFYYRPRIDRELIEKYREGLIAILPAMEGEHAARDSAPRAREILRWYKERFPDTCYSEITRHPDIEGHEARMKKLIELSREAKIPLVASSDSYYLKPDDAFARELVDKIRTAGTISRDFDQGAHDFSFLARERAVALFKDLPEALENAARIADTCTLSLTLGKAIFPQFPIPPGTTDDGELRALAEKGIAERDLADTPDLRKRMDYELGIIAKKGYASYFLIVADMLRHARKVGIYTNTRGSAAGSLVSYLCGITSVDPIQFQMPFERFLNPERPTAPDIDMDIADNRRDELIEYVRRRYGDEKVAQIGTFGTMMARGAVRDVARALGHSYSLGDTIAKLIPFGKQGFPVTIESALNETPDLKQVYDHDADAREVLDLAQKIEGNARHVGVHAAGVVIAPSPVTDFAPIQHDPKGGKTITQYDMYSVADEYGGIGLLKFDMLGLTNLSVLADSVARVQARLGTTIDLDRIPLDDKKTYEMLARGETLGVFQMAGGGMTAYLKELQPTVIHDLNAMVALYRPGPMAFIPEYIQRKKNPSRVRYLDPRMEQILKPTYGVLIYQDDVMMIAVELAGYSWGEADKLRKAMGKKIPTEMQAQKDRLIKGCIERGMRKDIAQKLWEQIETFAAYGFNKAHAASYGNLAYKTAYMKANFPVDYMAAVLTADAGDVEKVAEVVTECKRMGIRVWPPSVNESYGDFTVVAASIDSQGGSERDGARLQGSASRPNPVPLGDSAGGNIRFGLYSIKNFGTGVGDSIIAARTLGGPFKDIADFLSRIIDKNLNKKSLESLIQCGALDELGERGQLMSTIDTLLAFHREHVQVPTDQGSLFGSTGSPRVATLKLPQTTPATLDQRLTWEKELLGLYVSGHPLDKHKAKFADPKKSIHHAKEHLRGVETVIGGFIENARVNLTKNGERMAFLKIVDFSDSIEVVAFPRFYKENESLMTQGSCVALRGKISDRNGQPSFVAERAKAL